LINSLLAVTDVFYYLIVVARSKFYFLLLSALSGLLISLAFPPFNLSFLAWVALVPLLYIVFQENQSSRRVFFSIITFALVYFGFTLRWLLTINHWYPFGGWLAWMGVMVLGMVWLCGWGWLVLLGQRWAEKNPRRDLVFFFIPALAWAFVEWLRQWGTYGSTLGWLGYSQWTCFPIAQWARWGGVPGISGFIVLVNTALAMALCRQRVAGRFLAMTGILLLGCFLFGSFILRQPVAPLSFTPVVLRANVPQDQKLNPVYYEMLKARYITLIKTAVDQHPSSDAIFFLPETIVPMFLERDPLFLSQLAQSLGKFPLIFGSPTWRDGKIYNSALVFQNGAIADRYNKVHLVPFGEYLPVPVWAKRLFQKNNFFSHDYVQGKGFHPLTVGSTSIGVGICFESMLPSVYRSFVRNGAQVLAVISNDAWFLDSPAGEQHLMASVFRAIENHRWMIQCAKGGISGVVGPRGMWVQKK
jgi:apolipoprotein N-acyltransferase